MSQSNKGAESGSSRHYKYTKVLDNRKHPIRGLWRRNGKFLARITVEDDAGRKEIRWVPLAAKTAAEAQEEFRKLMVERTENRLRHIGPSPKPRSRSWTDCGRGLDTDTTTANLWSRSIPGLDTDKLRSWLRAGCGHKLDMVMDTANLRSLTVHGLDTAMMRARTDCGRGCGLDMDADIMSDHSADSSGQSATNSRTT